jgi:hypothetical protein
MKIRNKIIALMISLIAMPTFAVAKDGPYIGVKASSIKIDFITTDGFNLNSLVENDFKALDAHIGYNVGNGFFELGYLNSDKGTKSGTSTSGGVTITTTNFGYEFDGYRLGAGYNYNVGSNIVLKPFINYYDLKFTASGTISASDGSTTVSGNVSGSERDQAIDAGLGLDYVINDKSKIGISYSQFIDKFTDTDSTKVYSISFSHQF